MLQYLRVRDLAVVEESALEFGPGFTAITGETGAGKSVLLGALALIAGQRADKSKIRHGSDSLEVEAALHMEDPARVDALLDEMGLPCCEDGLLLLQRSLSQSKPPRIQVNGRLTTQANLQALGELWLDVHGPGEPQTLFKAGRQLELLDTFARNADQLATYARGYGEWTGILKQIDALRTSERLSPDEEEFLRGQLEMIEQADLSEEGVAELERNFSRLESAQELIEGGSHLADLLNGDGGAGEKLGDAAVAARNLARLDKDLLPLADRIESVLIEVADIAEEFENAARACEFDEEAAQAIRERMELWLQLKRKYGPEVGSVLAKRDALAKRLGSQGDVEGQILRLEQQASKARASIEVQAEQLRERRVQAAVQLSKQATALLGRLGFKHASMKIEVRRTNELTAHGNSTCEILFSPNPGQEPQPLTRIASSGELARVMLALKTVLAAADETPVLVFDEVDANVGGEVAVEVGRELAGLGARHQVFCVTHLPQVAAQASAHFVVEKTQSESSTHVEIRPLHHKNGERVGELARMLGGRNNKAAIEHAQTLLEAGH